MVKKALTKYIILLSLNKLIRKLIFHRTVYISALENFQLTNMQLHLALFIRYISHENVVNIFLTYVYKCIALEQNRKL